MTQALAPDLAPMNSTETSVTLPSATATSPVATAASASAANLVTVLCPKGFTPGAIEDPSAQNMLFARVTYRPE